MNFDVRDDGTVVPWDGGELRAFLPRDAAGRGGSGSLRIDALDVEPTGVSWSSVPLLCDCGSEPTAIPVSRYRTPDGSSIDLSPVMGPEGQVREESLTDLLRTAEDVEALPALVPSRYRSRLLRNLYSVGGSLMWERTALIVEVTPRRHDARTCYVDAIVHEGRNGKADHVCFDPSELGIVDRWAAAFGLPVAGGSAARAARISDLTFAATPRPGRSPLLWVGSGMGLPLSALNPGTLSAVAELRAIPVMATLRPSREHTRQMGELAERLAAERELLGRRPEDVDPTEELRFDLGLFRVRAFVEAVLGEGAVPRYDA